MKQPTLKMKFAFIIAIVLLVMQTAIIGPVIGAMQSQGTVNETPAGRTGGFGGLLHWDIKIESHPAGAHVFLNGKDTGKVTPATLFEYPGDYKVDVVAEGYPPFSTKIEVRNGLAASQNGTAVRIVVDFDQPATGLLDISSYTKGVSVALDGEFKGSTPLTISNVPAGPHVLTFSRTDEKDTKRTVMIYPGIGSYVRADTLQLFTPESTALANPVTQPDVTTPVTGTTGSSGPTPTKSDSSLPVPILAGIVVIVLSYAKHRKE